MNNFNYKIFVDNGPLVDRYLAYLAGIGYYGINNNLITDKYGSYVFIGYIVNNYDLEPDNPTNKTCIKCNKCVKYCPGNALEGNYKMDPKKCVSFITQKKEELTSEEVEKMNKRINLYLDVIYVNKFVLIIKIYVRLILKNLILI